ncbi:MAG: ABC transporter permease [Clostridia bacterium]|nr:ABC transporter permease [Clostridia bacterium]
MHILKNSLVSIFRNKGRNILIGLIILTIACSTTVTLAIRNTANNIVKSYEESNDLIATISFDRSKLMGEFKGGEDAQKENIEAFNNIESYTLENVKNYGESDYLKGYYYTYSTSLNSDTLSKATDSFEYEVEDKQTSTSTNTTTSTTPGSGSNRPNMPGGGSMGERHTMTEKHTTTIITKTKEIFESSRNLTGDFQLDGYSSYDAMTNFVDGTYQVTDGEMISDFSAYQCVISNELATLNEVAVGNTITLKNPTTEKTYDFTVTGIYKDNNDNDESARMYSGSANTIIVGSGVIELLVADDNTLVTNLTPSFILNGEEAIEAFETEIREKGLNEYYKINTNLEELQNATKSIENVKTFATTFLLITLIISSLVLFVINMINIRERKYEIGVFRTIGMSKFKLTIQFIVELLLVAGIALIIGAVIGGFLAKPVGNMLLENEIETTQSEQEQISNNFGRGGSSNRPEMKFNSREQVEIIDSIEAVVDYIVILQLLGIGILLTLMSSLASMISIQRFSPLTILKERS